MLRRLSRFLGLTAAASPPSPPPGVQPLAAQAAPKSNPDIDNGVGHLAQVLHPGAPERQGEPIPRWPEYGAAMVAATPDELLATQHDLLVRLKETCTLSGGQFDELLMPALRRYAAWVHLLPASEQHHHYGPGGLLRHGFEVALHAARMANGRQVGLDLPPSQRTAYTVRWRVATLLGGLLHDIGKPLVDCGATDPDRTITWPAAGGDLYSWLLANGLTHYRIYWRSGARHERHKPVGTAVMREILGPELLAWLADEPTQEVVTLLMMTVGGQTSASNVMSVVVSRADSMSVEADLKRLAQRTQATATGGPQSGAGMVMAKLRKLVENNRLVVNRTGGQLWVLDDGCYGVFPALLDAVAAELTREAVPGLPANRTELAELLATTGFIEVCQTDTEDGRQRSVTWDLRVELRRCDEVTLSAPIKVIKFADARMVFGSTPIPPPTQGQARSPFLSAEDAERIADSVTVAIAPQSAASALGKEASQPDPAVAPAPVLAAGDQGDQPKDEDAPSSPDIPPRAATTTPAEEGAGEPAQPEVHVPDRRNSRDIATERRREAMASEKPKATMRELSDRIAAVPMVGAQFLEILRQCCRGNLVYGTDYFGNSDGLVLRYPEALKVLGSEPEDMLEGAVAQRWVITDEGSNRQVSERTFPDGVRRQCVILAGDMGRAWEALCAEYPAVLDPNRPRPAGEREASERAPAPALSAPPPAPPAPAPQPPRQQQAPRPSAPSNAQRPANGQATPPSRPAPANQGQRPVPARAAPAPAKPAPSIQIRQDAPAPSEADRSRSPSLERKLARPAVGAAPAKRPAPPAPPTAPAPATRLPAKPFRCERVADLTPEKIADINAYFVFVAEHSAQATAHLSEQERLQAVMRVLVMDGGVRAAPLLAALTTPDNPAVLMDVPASRNLKDISNIRLNPDYVRPQWVIDRLARASTERSAPR